MAYPIVSVRSRVLPEEPQGPSFIEAGAEALLGVLERDRAERREEEQLVAQRQHATDMVRLQDTLARQRDLEQFTRERPFMETPGERRAGEKELMGYGSGLRREEAAFDASLRAPFENWQRNFQEREFSYRTLRDQLDYNLREAGLRLERERETRLGREGTTGGAPGGIPASVWSSLFSSEAIDPTDLAGNPEVLRGLDVLDQYLRGVRLPEPPEEAPVVEEERGPGILGAIGGAIGAGARAVGGAITGYGGPLAPAPGRAAPAGRATGAGPGGGEAVLGPGGTGAGPNVQPAQGRRDPKYPEAEWFSRQSSDVVGSSGIFPDDVMRKLTIDDHIKFLNDVLIPEGDTAEQYIERLFEVDPRIAEQVQARVRGRRP